MEDKKIFKDAKGVLIKEFKTALDRLKDVDNMLSLVDKHKVLIEKVITDYNYKGMYFKAAYLPAILALALEKQEKEFTHRVCVFDEEEEIEEGDSTWN